MIPVDDALRRLLSLVPPVQAEPLALAQAAGRVLWADAVADRAQPPFAASAMDGYAIATQPMAGQTFDIIGTAQAGAGFSGRVGPGEAVRIFTGASVPQGAQWVVIQEDVTRDGARITISDTLGDGRNIRPAGADFSAGYRLTAPRRLRAADLALLAAMNCATLSVARKPVVALIATGDELVQPGEPPGPNQIVASNIFALKAMAEAEGAHVRLLPIARDTQAALTQVLALARGADVIVTIGGASVGDHDLVARVAEAEGMELAFHKIAMRPGKPLLSGRLDGSILLGLPGNPVSAIICGHLFLVPLVRALQGLPDPAPRPLRARLVCDLPANGPRAHYMRAVLTGDDGLPMIDPFPDQDSGRLTPLAGAQALLIRPVSAPAATVGDVVDYLPLV